MSDFSRWVCFALIDAGLEEAAARAFERKLRKELGGTRHYIAKTVPQDRVDPPTDRAESPRRDATTPSGTSLPDRPS